MRQALPLMHKGEVVYVEVEERLGRIRMKKKRKSHHHSQAAAAAGEAPQPNQPTYLPLRSDEKRVPIMISSEKNMLFGSKN